MSDQNSRTLSISFRVDEGIVEHNNRDFIAKNVDKERIGDNITYTRQDIREKYSALFGKALAEYNAKQKQASRRIPDYYEHILKSGKGKPFYEIVVQFGDTDTCGLKSGKWEEAKLMLDEYMKGFERRNPNLKVFNAVMHLDEATPHLHIDFIPIAHKVERGLSVKVSMKGALREQGFTSANKMQNEWSAWEEQERDVMTAILRAHDLTRDVKNDTHEYLTVDEYKKVAAQKAEIKKVNAHINELKKKSPSELTQEEIALIKNQNDFLRSEILNFRDKVAAMSRKLGADFIPFEIFSDEKLMFVAEELKKSGIPFVEDSHALHIPDYAEKTAVAIADSFHPVKAEGIREKIKLEIDRLVYSCDSLEDLLTKLKERGYEIKQGANRTFASFAQKCGTDAAPSKQTKSILAVKPTFAERFVRLKTLGEEYIPKILERRISDRNKFTDAVQAKYQTATPLEKKFHVTIMNVVIEVKQFRLIPPKTNSRKIYVFQNDENINYLSRQLLTIGELGITSKEQMYAKAEELKKSIDEQTAKIKSLSDEIPTLRSDISQLRFLFSSGARSTRSDAMTQTKIAAAQEIANKYGIKSAEGIEELEKRLKTLPNEITSAKDKLADEQLKHKRVSDLIRAFEEIVEGNYIDNLIRAQKEREQTKTAVSITLKKS